MKALRNIRGGACVKPPVNGMLAGESTTISSQKMAFHISKMLGLKWMLWVLIIARWALKWMISNRRLTDEYANWMVLI